MSKRKEFLSLLQKTAGKTIHLALLYLSKLHSPILVYIEKPQNNLSEKEKWR